MRGRGVSAVFVLLSCFIAFLLYFSPAHAQTVAAPNFFVTWRSGAYVESAYQGKILPTAGAPLTIAFELIDGGKLANLSKTMIRWIKNDKIVQSGIGLQTVTIPTSPIADRDEIRIKIVVSQYKGADLPHSFVLPVAAPEVVIRAPFVNRFIPTGTQTLRALFYYWNTDRAGTLIANWSLQGERLTTSGGNRAATITLPQSAAGQSLHLTVSATNEADNLELASASQTLTIAQ